MHTKRLSEVLVPLRNSQPGRGVPYGIYRIDIRTRTQQQFDDFMVIKFVTIKKSGQQDGRLRAAYRRSGSAPADSRGRAIEDGFERNPINGLPLAVIPVELVLRKAAEQKSPRSQDSWQERAA